MTWFRVDDQWADHPKVQAAGLHGRALWTAAGTKCAALNTDGRVDGRLVKLYAAVADVNAKRASVLLVESGLWHDAETIQACGRCLEAAGALLPSDFYFHDWLEYQLAREGKDDPIARRHDTRRKQLHRMKLLCAEIRARDRDACRYCGVLTTWTGDRRSKTAGTYDHIDPFGDNVISNVVVACRACNGQKRDRTPEQAGMPLLPAPGPYLVPTNPGSTLAGRSDQAAGLQDQAGSVGSPRVTRETGPGQVGLDGRAGLGEVGPGRAPGPGVGPQ